MKLGHWWKVNTESNKEFAKKAQASSMRKPTIFPKCRRFFSISSALLGHYPQRILISVVSRKEFFLSDFCNLRRFENPLQVNNNSDQVI